MQTSQNLKISTSQNYETSRKIFQPQNILIGKFFIDKNYWLKIRVMILESVGPTIPDSHFTYIWTWLISKRLLNFTNEKFLGLAM